MRRLFTLALGLGAGATAAVLVSRWMRKKREAVSPRAIGTQVASGARDLGSLVRAALDEGRKAMVEREAEIRRALPQ